MLYNFYEPNKLSKLLTNYKTIYYYIKLRMINLKTLRNCLNVQTFIFPKTDLRKFSEFQLQFLKEFHD